ncbi:hypothetical protein EVAR_21390_1 [Eumeta japonica]|uniref:Uncharacterized protein n=1 Tax=Eumeta variegata TaxID=151549 RepID=A0A4C1VJH2_EUMVA|nr:hypothetical protein EVAR_21390_1 [Eumeta japonica]
MCSQQPHVTYSRAMRDTLKVHRASINIKRKIIERPEKKIESEGRAIHYGRRPARARRAAPLSAATKNAIGTLSMSAVDELKAGARPSVATSASLTNTNYVEPDNPL